MKSPTIETERLVLRPFKESDAVLWQVWDVDEEVQAHMPEPLNEPQDVSTQHAYLKECEADQEGCYWSVETKAGETIGTVALADINGHHRVAEIGIVIGEKRYWGRGFATEVVRAIVRFAFETLGLVRLNAETEADNIAMVNVLENAGFAQDGLFSSARAKKGGRVDVRHFGIVDSREVPVI